MERIGILGGTFDPPHIGHLWLAESAVEALQLDKVLFLPAGIPPHKDGRLITTTRHRLAMTGLAVTSHERFFIDDIDTSRPPPHYTATLLPLISQRYPQSELWLLVGSDALRDLPTWHAPDVIVRSARLAVLSRPSVNLDWVTLWQAVPGLDGAVTFLPGPFLSISAVSIRQAIAAGRSVRNLVPQNVLDYINSQGLYR